MAVYTRRVSRIAKHKRVRKKIKGTPERPRMAVFRSSRHISVQVIDDINGVTLASASTLHRSFREVKIEGGKREAAAWVGEEIARRMKEKGVETAVFDRGGFEFHGRVKSLADAARKSGIKI